MKIFSALYKRAMVCMRAFRNATSCSPCPSWPRTPTVLCLLLLVGLTGCAMQHPAPVVTPRAEPLGAEGRPQYYRVVRGDSLYSIAWRYALDYRQLAAWNGINPPYLIYVDQHLRLYPQASAPRSERRIPPSETAAIPGPPEPNEKAPARAMVAVKTPASKGKRTATAHTTGPHPTAQAPQATSGESMVAHGTNHWIWPTRGSVVQTFVSGDRTRQGIRIAGHLGQDVVAAESGRVVYSGSGLPGYGQLIIIKHTKNYLSAYGFNRKLLVREGSRVTRGERVSEMGNSADGKPMLHFEIRHGDRVLDPMQLLPPQ